MILTFPIDFSYCLIFKLSLINLNKEEQKTITCCLSSGANVITGINKKGVSMIMTVFRKMYNSERIPIFVYCLSLKLIQLLLHLQKYPLVILKLKIHNQFNNTINIKSNNFS